MNARPVLLALVLLSMLPLACTDSDSPHLNRVAADPWERSFVDTATLTYSHGVSLHLKASLFNSSAHSISSCGDCPVCRIDGSDYYGSDCDTPRAELRECCVEIDGALIDLDVSEMYNPWNTVAERDFILAERRVIHDRPVVVVTGLFSDAAGAYVAEWQVTDGRSLRTIIELAESDIGEILESRFKFAKE